MAVGASQLSATTRLFSPGVFREMAKKGRSPLFTRLLGLSKVRDLCAADATVGHAFESAFGVLKTIGLRDEYVYRAALTNKVLMGTHSLNTACMLTEFRVGACKADLVILNGTATVYEIKSERDSLSRLANRSAVLRAFTNSKVEWFSSINLSNSASIDGQADPEPASSSGTGTTTESSSSLRIPASTMVTGR